MRVGREQRRVALAQGDRLLARQRAGGTRGIATSRAAGAARRGRPGWARRVGIAHQPRHARSRTRWAAPRVRARSPQFGAFEHPVRDAAAALTWRRSGARACARPAGSRSPAPSASSATEADFTPARLPNRSSSCRRRLGPTPGNVEQLGGDGARRAPLAVVGEAEAVRLVARALQQPERRAPPREPEALGASREEDLLLPLGQAHDGNRPEAELLAARRAPRSAVPCRRR